MKSISLLFIALLSCQISNASGIGKETKAASAKDSVNTVKVVFKAIDWYKANLDALNKIRIVDNIPGTGYKVNFRTGEKYLTSLKSSALFTDYFLNEWRTYFRERQQGFVLKAQHEGVPLGFEYDFVLLSENPSEQLKLNQSPKILSAKAARGKAVVQFEYGYVYEFNLVWRENRWIINEILNLSLE